MKKVKSVVPLSRTSDRVLFGMGDLITMEMDSFYPRGLVDQK